MQRFLVHIFSFALICSLTISGYSQQIGVDFSSHVLNPTPPRPDNDYNNISQFYLKDSIHTYHYSVSDSNWVLQEKSYFSYDDEGMERERIEMERGINNEFYSAIRYLYNYNNLGLLEVQLLQLYDGNDNKWIDSKKYTYSNFTSHGKETLILTESWDPLNSEWEEQYRVEKVYDALNRLTSKIDKELVDGTWVLNQRIDLDYSTNGNLSKETSYHYSTGLNLWEANIRISYNYNSENLLTSSLNSVWSDDNGGGWDSLFVSELQYNAQGKPVSMKQIGLENSNTLGVELISQISEFDANGNLEEISNEVWLEDEEEWVPADRSEYFYSSRLNTKLSLGEDEISCIFSNPYHQGSIWLCDGMRENDLYTLRILDLQGKILYSNSILPNQPFNIPVQLKQGLYLVNISGSTITHTEKVIFE